MNKTRSLFLFLALSVLLIVPLQVGAFQIETESSIVIEKDQEIKKNLYSMAQEIRIDGTVNGDVFCLAENLIITGKIDGDLICAAKNISMNGELTGDLRVAAETITINGKTAGNANVLAKDISMGAFSSIGKTLLLFVEKADLKGRVDRNVEGILSHAEISGKIHGNVDLELWDEKINAPLILNEQSYIGGNLNYKSFNKKALIAKGAYVNGGVNQSLLNISKKNRNPFGPVWFFSLAICLILGLLIAGLWKKRSLKIIQKMSSKPWPSIGWGSFFFLIIPLVFVLFFITLIGIPLALMLGFSWLIITVIAKILVGILLGKKLLETINIQKDNLFLAAAIGIIIIKVLFALPFVGWFLGLVAILWGSGAIWLSFRPDKKTTAPSPTINKRRPKAKTKKKKTK